FVRGRSHPMIDPTLRNQRILKEGRDPNVGVLLFDIVLGHGSHEDPAGAIIPTLIQVKKEAQKNGRHLSFVATVVGTDEDPQGLAEQMRKLKEIGCHVFLSNVQATVFAALLVSRGKAIEKIPQSRWLHE
ncbi:MAG: hypothetical protein ACXACA_00545, partial [Candidatus Ranarchaeia archaeon]